MKRFLWCLSVMLWLTAVSCSPATVIEESKELSPIDSDERGLLDAAEPEPGIFPRSTLTPPPVSDPIDPETAPGVGDPGYPAPLLPSPTPPPDGYVIPTPYPPVNPYPEATGNLVWILKPVGEQCAETPATPELQTAVADMVAFGVPVEASEMTDLPVCSACGCPTSAHFRLQIDAGFLDSARALGWFVEQ